MGEFVGILTQCLHGDVIATGMPSVFFAHNFFNTCAFETVYSLIIRSDRRSDCKVEKKLIGSDRHNFRPGIHTVIQSNVSYSILNLLWCSMSVFRFIYRVAYMYFLVHTTSRPMV